MTATFKIIPAPPGYSLLALYPAEGEEAAFVVKTMLVGWRVPRRGDTRSDAEPIGLICPGTNATYLAVLLPDGTAEDMLSGNFESERAWFEHMCRLAAGLDDAQSSFVAQSAREDRG